MKMRKITALALAGALCLGMSTVAFAADSPQKNDAIQATEEGKEIIVNDKTDSVMDDWAAVEPEDLDEAIKDTFREEYRDYKKELDKKDPDDVTANQRKQLELLDSLANDDAAYEVVTIADIKPAAGTDVDPDHPLKVRFNLNGKLENLAVGQTIRILHLVNNTTWQVYETKVALDDNGYYAEWAFEHFSPVAVFRVNSDGSVTPEEPTTPNPEEPTVTPDVNGTITADQLAELIVKKLQENANATKVVRTSVKASPKTGE